MFWSLHLVPVPRTFLNLWPREEQSTRTIANYFAMNMFSVVLKVLGGKEIQERPVKMYAFRCISSVFSLTFVLPSRLNPKWLTVLVRQNIVLNHQDEQMVFCSMVSMAAFLEQYIQNTMSKRMKSLLSKYEANI